MERQGRAQQPDGVCVLVIAPRSPDSVPGPVGLDDTYCVMTGRYSRTRGVPVGVGDGPGVIEAVGDGVSACVAVGVGDAVRVRVAVAVGVHVPPAGQACRLTSSTKKFVSLFMSFLA